MRVETGQYARVKMRVETGQYARVAMKVETGQYARVVMRVEAGQYARVNLRVVTFKYARLNIRVEMNAHCSNPSASRCRHSMVFISLSTYPGSNSGCVAKYSCTVGV